VSNTEPEPEVDTMQLQKSLLALLFASTTVIACGGSYGATGSGDVSATEAALGSGSSLSSARGPGAVYLMSNATGGNEIIVFDRDADGQLTPAGTQPTGGNGTGSGLGNQASLILTEDHRRLYAVNAGTGDVSAFKVTGISLQPIGAPVDSGGELPVSLTVHGDLLYVLNAGGTGNIAGFRVGVDGALTPIDGSARPLSAPAAGAAQITFSPDGRILVVTEKATNTISTYVVESDGTASGPNAHPSAGTTPFGFSFNDRGDLVVSEAGGGPGGATASSYRVGGDGQLELISGPVATTQTAACWIAISEDGGIAFTTNTGSGTISRLAIGPGGALELEEAVAGMTGPGSAPQDASFTPGGRFLYVRNDAGNVGAFRLEGNGALTHVGDFGPLPAGANGIAVR
jgi:6-phosphogluconolactonase (cycloisomerase 2 family)